MELPEQAPPPSPDALINERAAYFDSLPADAEISPAYLENMRDRMPGSAERSAMEEMMATDESMRVLFTEPNADLGPDYSPIRLGRSAVQFWKDVDAAVSKTDGGIETMRELSHAVNDAPGGSEQRNSALRRLNQAMVPVYRSLREMGYSYTDIVN